MKLMSTYVYLVYLERSANNIILLILNKNININISKL